MDDNSTENAAGTRTGNSGGGDCKAQKKNPGLPSTPKSCKGYLLYNLLRHSKSKGLTCFGINGTYDKIPPRILRAADLKASERGASSNKDFMYACLGYSIYFDDKSSSQKKPPKVPYCLGVELIGYISATTTESKGRDHANPQPQGHEHATPRPRGNSKPAHVPVEEFLNRLRRNMGVVALGVAKNLKRTGNHVKKTLGGILNSNRKEPK